MNIEELGELVRKNVDHVHEETEGAVNLGFIWVVKTPEFDITAEVLVEAIKECEQGWYGNLSIERLNAGPSYIELGGWIGDQTLALLFMGLGQMLGLWNIVTPATLGVTDPDQAASLMGIGYVMVGPKADSPLRTITA